MISTRDRHGVEPFLPFSRPSITPEDIAAVNDVLRSGWITTGSQCFELEQRFVASVGCRHAVALNSARVCSLPLFPDMTPADVDRVVDTVRTVLDEARR